MGDPLTLSTITAGISTCIKLCEVTYQLKAVGEQTADLLNTTQHVELNVREARRLRRVKDKLLNAGERAWMDRVIEDTENAVRAVAQLIEPSRVGMQTEQRIDLATKATWVFRDSPKVRDKFARLSICHQSLNTVMACLYSRDVVVVAPVMEEGRKEPPLPYDPQPGELFSWRRSRRRRKGDSVGSKTESVGSLTPISPTSAMMSPELSSSTYSPSAAKGQADLQSSERPGCNRVTRSHSEDLLRPSTDSVDSSDFGSSTLSMVSHELPAATDCPPTDQGGDGLQACEGSAVGWSWRNFPGHDGLQVCEGSGPGWSTQSYSEERPGLTQEQPKLTDSRPSNGRRGRRRAWLAYQAARSDIGHG